MDLVYIVRPGENNDELRYSLRTVDQHLEHDRVVIVGHTPTWLTGVESIETQQVGTKHANARANMVTACTTQAISDPFILMNDDFFLTAPVDQVPDLHHGPLAAELADYQSRYPLNQRMIGMGKTLDLLRTLGHHDPLSYELHVPMIVDKATMLEGLGLAEQAGIEVPHIRSLHGNLAGAHGTYADDVKVYTYSSVELPKPFVSTSDRSFRAGWIGRRLRANFDQTSQHEAVPVRV